MWAKISDRFRSFLSLGPSETAIDSRKRRLEGSDSTETPKKRLRSDEGKDEEPDVLVKQLASWVVSKQRSFRENYYVRQLAGSPKALMKKLSSLTDGGQEELPIDRQPFMQPGFRVDQSAEVQYGREIMSAMQGMQIHSTPVNNPPKGYNFTNSNFDFDQPEMFSFQSSPIQKYQFRGRPSLPPRIQDVGTGTGPQLMRPPIRPRYSSNTENVERSSSVFKHPEYKSVYEKTFSGQHRPRHRLHGQRHRTKMAVRESIRIEERVRYAELLQQFTAAPVLTKMCASSTSQKKATDTSGIKHEDTLIGSKVTDISAEQFFCKYRPEASPQSRKIKVGARTTQTLNKSGRSDETLMSSLGLRNTWPPERSRDLLQRDPELIDLTESAENSDQTSSSGEKFSARCSASPAIEIVSTSSSASSRSGSSSAESVGKSIQDSKYIKDDWLKDMLRKITLESKVLKDRAHEEEIKAEYYKEKRKHWDKDTERRIQQRLRLSEREPVVIEEPYEEEEEEEVEEFPELTEEQDAVVDSALIPYPPDEKIAEGFRLELTRSDIHTLEGLNWLNDEVINFYMNLLMERSTQAGYPKVHAFNTFFYPKILKSGQQGVRRWTKKVDIFSMDYVLVPVHLGMHWCLAVIDFRKKEIRYYDSMGGNNHACLDALRRYLIDESMEKKKERFDMSNWKLLTAKDIPQQLNGSDCGMFACKFAEYITRDVAITFSQEHMPYFRRRMIYEILTKQLM